ncbi:hypothetical protein ACKWTF_008532 [Chironomus riparius]
MLVTSERIIFVLIGFISIALCMPAVKDNEVYLVDYSNERSKDGSYSFNYELSDGQSRTEKGTLKDGKDADGNDIKILSVTGQYAFVAPNGQKFVTFYISDEVMIYLLYFNLFLTILLLHQIERLQS